MIQLTRLNGHPITLNGDLVRFVEQSPDTLITLVSGDKLLVLESPADVADAMRNWRASVLRSAWPLAADVPAMTAAAQPNQ